MNKDAACADAEETVVLAPVTGITLKLFHLATEELDPEFENFSICNRYCGDHWLAPRERAALIPRLGFGRTRNDEQRRIFDIYISLRPMEGGILTVTLGVGVIIDGDSCI